MASNDSHVSDDGEIVCNTRVRRKIDSCNYSKCQIIEVVILAVASAALFGVFMIPTIYLHSRPQPQQVTGPIIAKLKINIASHQLSRLLLVTDDRYS